MVVLPAPFLPSNPNALPLSTWKSTPWSTSLSPKLLRMPFTSNLIMTPICALRRALTHNRPDALFYPAVPPVRRSAASMRTTPFRHSPPSRHGMPPGRPRHLGTARSPGPLCSPDPCRAAFCRSSLLNPPFVPPLTGFSARRTVAGPGVLSPPPAAPGPSVSAGRPSCPPPGAPR